MKKILNIVAGLFLAVGVILLIATYVVHSNYEDFKSHADLVDAEIVDMTASQDNVRVLIAYEYDGKSYGPAMLNGYSSSMYVGGTVEIYVDRENPSDFSWGRGIAQTILLILGLVFAGIGGGIFLVRAISGSGAKRLVKEGDKLVGKVENVSRNTAVEINGENPWVVVCTWTKSNGEIYRFKSKNIYTDPMDTFRPGDDIIIYVDRNNMKKYYVDVDQKMSMIHDM